jgi:anaerobic ribonucleoside-triphosphate reductase activating protein
MDCAAVDIVFQEVPEHISICFSIPGCALQCEGCHSAHLWKQNKYPHLNLKDYLTILKTYKGMADCVLFMGGEWNKSELIQFLMLAKALDYKTCLYTGQTEVDDELLAQLNYIKTGPWKKELGGLSCPGTNQRFTNLETNQNLNHLFIKEMQ